LATADPLAGVAVEACGAPQAEAERHIARQQQQAFEVMPRKPQVQGAVLIHRAFL
jgi:hypothetical protein